MQQVVVIPCRRFGTTCWSQIQKLVPKRRQGITTTCCIINQRCTVLLQSKSILQKPCKLFSFTALSESNLIYYTSLIDDDDGCGGGGDNNFLLN